jgi:protein-S-isoprenylcysteine O-methyltransferase Ste14
MKVIELIFFGVWIIFYTYWLISAWRNRSPFKRKESRLSLLSSMTILIVIWMIFTSWLEPGLMLERIVPDTFFFAFIGLLVTCAGLGFAIWARVHLGTFWSGLPAIRVDHKIIRTGPYRIVRHPIYAGILLGVTGTAIALGYFWIICTIFLMLAAFLLKIRMEEKFLKEEFGEEYTRYKAEVKALIPFLV